MEEVKQILANGHREDNLFFLPEGQLDGKTYGKVKKVLSNMRANWKTNKKGFLIDNIEHFDADLDAFINEGKSTDRKKEFQFFATPPDVQKFMKDALWNTRPERVSRALEPSAGDGALITGVLLAHGIDPKAITAVELDERQIPKLEEIRATHGDFRIVHNDFLKTKAEKKFDLIVANPPFTKNQDIDHVNHMLDMLEAGGTLVAIMSPHFTFASDRKSKDFRDRIRIFGNHNHTEIPEGAFKGSGTNVKTVLLVVRKV